jgi:hypothetical protein
MKRTWTIIGVRDVPASFRWYQSLFGQPETPPGQDYFGQILDTDGTVLLCLHRWGAHEHPSLMSPDEARPGNGLLLFFRVDDFMALKRARALVPRPQKRDAHRPAAPWHGEARSQAQRSADSDVSHVDRGRKGL